MDQQIHSPISWVVFLLHFVFMDFKGQGTDLCFLTLLLDNEWCSPSLLNEKAKCTHTHVLCVYGVCVCGVCVQCVCVVCGMYMCALCVVCACGT